MSNRGRTSLLEEVPAVGDAVVKAIRQGLPYKHAAALAGVSEATLDSWKYKGGQPDAKEIYVEFLGRLKQARAEWVQETLQGIQAASTGEKPDWKAGAWLLERRERANFGSNKAPEDAAAAPTKLLILDGRDASAARKAAGLDEEEKGAGD